MKIQYLGFIPGIIVVLFCHWQVITGYMDYKRTGNIFSINPICLAIVIVYWITTSVIGFLWGIQ